MGQLRPYSKITFLFVLKYPLLCTTGILDYLLCLSRVEVICVSSFNLIFCYLATRSQNVKQRCLFFLHCFFTVALSSGWSVGVMAVLLVHLVSIVLPFLHNPSQAFQSCPVSCRCYSLTVECGSTGLKGIPRHVPPSTQVGRLCWKKTFNDIVKDV